MDDETPVSKGISRRRVVAGAVGAAAVGAAATAAITIPDSAGSKAAAAAPAPVAANAGSLPKEDWVIYVRNADNEAMDVFVGMQHFAVRDGDLVSRLIAAVTK